MKTKFFILALCAVALMSCGGSSQKNTSSDTKEMPKETSEAYNATNRLVGQLERKADKVLVENASVKEMRELYSQCEQLEFDYDPMDMEPVDADKCKELNTRIDSVKSSIRGRMDVLTQTQLVPMLDVEQEVLEAPKAFPVYLEKGDKLFYAVESEKPADIRIYNTDNHQLQKTYAGKRSVLDSLDIKYKGVYLIQITPKAHQYVDVRVGYRAGSIERLLYPKEVEIKEVEGRKGDFLVRAIPGIKMQNLFEEPRKFTLRSQLKATFSSTPNADRAIVAIQVPAGAKDVMYSLRISTNEGKRSSDGHFSDNLAKSYKKVKFLGIPLYERSSSHGSSLFELLLGENQPPREEEAYINMYVFYNAAQAKKFQDGADPTKLQYSIDYSTMGTQSCNGRIPTKGNRTIYMGYQNERVRYNNYVWLEAVSAVPNMEYLKTEYIVK